MNPITREDALALVASADNTAARDALVASMRADGVEAATFSEAELAEFGIVRGKRNVLKGSPNGSGPIQNVRTLKDEGLVLVILKPETA
jgi:hypothetical protein